MNLNSKLRARKRALLNSRTINEDEMPEENGQENKDERKF